MKAKWLAPPVGLASFGATSLGFGSGGAGKSPSPGGFVTGALPAGRHSTAANSSPNGTRSQKRRELKRRAIGQPTR